MKEARLYEKMDKKKVRCHLCSHGCIIGDGKRGICGVRENQAGVLYSLVYGKVIASHRDPIEKKPLFHFLPHSYSYSIGTVGCNFHCLFCQNADISQMPSEENKILGQELLPEDIVNDALNTKCSSISYTYTEPTIFYELAAETAEKAASKGLKNAFVTNGYMTEECLRELNPYLHAANVDLKAFTDKFYKEQCGARLDPVLRSIETMNALGIWTEVTTLLIPGLNDSTEELKEIARFLTDLDRDIPWHISRFHPTYRLTHAPPTPGDTIRRARDLGYEAGIKYVYTGNLPGDEGEKTFCHSCGEILIDRFGFQVMKNSIKDDRCPECGAEIPGVWGH